MSAEGAKLPRIWRENKRLLGGGIPGGYEFIGPVDARQSFLKKNATRILDEIPQPGDAPAARTSVRQDDIMLVPS